MQCSSKRRDVQSVAVVCDARSREQHDANAARCAAVPARARIGNNLSSIS